MKENVDQRLYLRMIDGRNLKVLVNVKSRIAWKLQRCGDIARAQPWQWLAKDKMN